MADSYIEINTDNCEIPTVGGDLYYNRDVLAKQNNKDAEVSIIIQTYNRLEKLKHCISSILTYTKGIDYELILIDNGSTDGTLEYLKSISYKKKRIIRVTKNLRVAFPSTLLCINDFAEFIVTVNDDVIVTEHWLNNLLACIKSDPKIGMVNPLCCNISNLQDPGLCYSSYEEMQEKAREFNRSDPKKWEERLRIVTMGNVFRKSVLLCIGWPLHDSGFFHDFGDDDMSFAIRRAGYKTILAGDTWICHDHDYSHGEDKDPEEYSRSLAIGRKNFCDKYLGVDAWEDVINFWRNYEKLIPCQLSVPKARILGIDVRCGTPILDIKNILRKNNVIDVELSAFTQDAKYWVDLKTICAGGVFCDREEALNDYFCRDYFDYVVIDRPINRYHEPQKLLQNAFSLCKDGGFVLCKLKNTETYKTYANILGQRNVYDRDYAYNISIEAAANAMKGFGKVINIVNLMENLGTEQINAISELLPREFGKQEKEQLINRMVCNEFLIVARK